MKQRPGRLVVVLLLVMTAGAASTACGPGGAPHSGGVIPTPLPTGTGATAGSPFKNVDEQLGQLMTEQASWQAPESLTVDRTQRVGLTIGGSPGLDAKVSQLIDHAVPRPAGDVPVGPTIRVTLQADAGDADVTPSGAIDESTGSNVALLWTWTVRPKHPSDGLELTAHIEVPSSGYTFTTDLGLDIPVHTTWRYTLGQVASSWQTLFGTGIGASALAVVIWLVRKRRRRPERDQPDPST